MAEGTGGYVFHFHASNQHNCQAVGSVKVRSLASNVARKAAVSSG